MNGKCPNDISSDLPFCCLDTDHLKEDEQVILYTKLIDETNSINKEFSEAVNALRKTLKQQNVDPSDIANYVFDAATYDSLTRLLQSDSQFTAESSSIDMIINYLQKKKYISFINYHIIEDLILKYGMEDDALKQSLQSYQEKFNIFAREVYLKFPRCLQSTAN